ncbi:glycosyltransferase [Corynebacterium choanae]|uniref:glycosyltransferase n=1 Tax=Corynebacterium choanae TaxID=1862358 RepID=UPI00248219D1|nr:glycosyltransferase [Corynebacterium choanae]
MERLQRVIMPRRGEPHDVRSLYLLEDPSPTGRVKFDSRTSVAVPAGCELSFETYFNAFPASYWRRWTQLHEVVLKVVVDGELRVDVYRSKIDGSRIAVDGAVVSDGAIEFVVPLKPFEDGGWIWFDVTADADATITEAGWYATAAPGPQVMPNGSTVGPFAPRVTVGIPTFNRPDDAVKALQALSTDEEVFAVIDAVIMPDQGTNRVADHPDYAAAIAPFGDRFFPFTQGNLGGSGGYSRIMYEALGGADGTGAAGQAASPYILYMDDDIAIEPDSVLRALQVARYASTPMLVGGQMLNLQERSHLHSMGEVIDRGMFMWTSAPHVRYDHDFAKFPLRFQGNKDDKPTDRNSKDLHRRIDVDYNGWWMCLIPRIVAEQIGQPLPLFIKWDDAEYGLRAGAAGFPTATWPGIAIWHMAWSDKDDAIDWQAYFHLRNRLVVAALYQDGDVKGLVSSIEKATLKHLLCLEYSTVAIQSEAIRDFLQGPDNLFRVLESSLPKVQAMRKEYSDAVVVPSATVFPAPSGAPGVPTKDVGGRLGVPKKIYRLARGLVHSFRPHDPVHHEVPQAHFAPIEARWFSLSRVDGATVTTADGTGVVYRKRDLGKARELWREQAQLVEELKAAFPQLQEQYRAAHDQLVSRSAWKQVFDGE